MTNLSYDQQMDKIATILRNEIKTLKSLPEEEAKKEARAGLIRVGIVDENGKITSPYAALRNRYV